MTAREKKYLVSEPIVAWGCFAILLASYWATVAPAVSFWDCPEYVSAAYLLEIGHPPGNPVWMLAERMVTLCVPPQYAALAINLSSGLLTAFAAFFLAKTIFRAGLWVLLKLPRRRIPAPLAAAGAACIGTLAFGWCDSVWYSAVEAEVYAMSVFMTSLCLWLMTKWAGTRSRGESWRLLVLIAYLFGLSIGIHQLNLLCIPALAMIWAVRGGIRSTGRLILIFFLSLIVVACVLIGMMPSTIDIAAKFELIAVNRFGWPALSGVAIYIVLLAVSLIVALYAVGHQTDRYLMALACYPAILLSGIFILSQHYIAGAVISAIVSIALVSHSNFQARRLYLAIWMLAMLLTGYSSYALIPVRGSIPSPANNVMPGEPFAFAAYQSRQQYGAKPLLYGHTPYSRTLLREEIDSDGHFSYRKYAFNYTTPSYVPKIEGGRLRSSTPGLSKEDSARNAAILARNGDGYILKSRHLVPIRTPELDMWFPRITGNSPSDMESYAEWIGMDTSNMVRVAVSEVIDTAGRPAPKADRLGNRTVRHSYRPSYLQSLQWFLTYQTAYMYWRYLMWNFVGRQNDRPAQGEVQHGNFITGIPLADNAMLGAEDSLPPVAGKDNPGRNPYFGLPFILGVLGIIWLLKSRRRGKQACAVNAILFLMTGIAITVYLNQDPCEPRERDYSFLGSYLAFAVWIAFGALFIARRFRSVWGFLIPLAIVGWMGYVNFDDHDRSNRFAAGNFARNILSSMEPDAIVFVNGDNFTFPLWYAQEVEGFRTDVRVINLAYLQTSVYAANQLLPWRDAPPVPSVFSRGDLIWDAFKSIRIPAESRDTVPAFEALATLRDNFSQKFPSRFVYLPVAKDSSFVFDLRNLSSNGSPNADFMKLMMFNIIAANSDSPVQRPVYWIGALTGDKRIGLTQAMSPWLFGYRFGIQREDRTDSLFMDAISRIGPVNPPGKKVYMDRAPSMMTSALRAPLIAGSRRLLRNGHTEPAIDAARRADVLLGNAPDSYVPMAFGDSLFRVYSELADLLSECADTLKAEAARRQLSPAEREKLSARCTELKARSAFLHRKFDARMNAWREYRKSLPERLRPKMAPVY